nr:hypothetical protein [Fredinandcohnia onubensis]
MAEESSFFNSVNGDRKYDMEAFATYFKQFLSSGLYHKNNEPSLRVTHQTGLTTSLEPGSAFLEGFMYRNTDNLLFTHDAPDATNPRIDRIVLRLDRNMSARWVRAFIKKGTPTTNPVPPTLQRDDLIYEISLAQARINPGVFNIASVIDERFDENVAGLVSSLITIPTSDFHRQWNEWFTGIQNQIGARLLFGSTEPSGAIAGDVWFKNL